MRQKVLRISIGKAIGHIQVIAPYITFVQAIQVAAENAVHGKGGKFTTRSPVVQKALIDADIHHPAIGPGYGIFIGGF